MSKDLILLYAMLLHNDWVVRYTDSTSREFRIHVRHKKVNITHTITLRPTK